MEEANAGQRRIARKLLRLANADQTRIVYSLPETVLTGKDGGYRYFLVIATPTDGREPWKYMISSCYGSYRGWFPGGDDQ
jgi:hypothetical protein